MKVSRVSLALLLSLGAADFLAAGQDLSFQTPIQENPGQAPQGRGSGQRGNRGGWRGGAMMGRGVIGTVTEITPEHFTVKTENGELYTIHYSVNTRIMKGSGGSFRRGQGGSNDGEFQPPPTPMPIKASEIKVGDAIGATGEMDANAKSVGAIAIVQIDPERAKEMREMQANYGKTWLLGKVVSINEVKVTLQGGPDNATHTFVADENTTFRKRRDPITLGDIQIGEMIRIEGSVKNGAFLATSVVVMAPPRQRDDGLPPPQ